MVLGSSHAILGVSFITCRMPQAFTILLRSSALQTSMGPALSDHVLSRDTHCPAPVAGTPNYEEGLTAIAWRSGKALYFSSPSTPLSQCGEGRKPDLIRESNNTYSVSYEWIRILSNP